MPRKVPVDSRTGCGAALVAGGASVSPPAGGVVVPVSCIAASGIGNASTTFLSRNVGTTSTTTAPIASTVNTPERTHVFFTSRGSTTNERRSQPPSSTALTTTARVLIKPERTAFGCTTSMTSMPPNRITCGTARTRKLGDVRRARHVFVSRVVVSLVMVHSQRDETIAEERERERAAVGAAGERRVRQARAREGVVVPVRRRREV